MVPIIPSTTFKDEICGIDVTNDAIPALFVNDLLQMVDTGIFGDVNLEWQSIAFDETPERCNHPFGVAGLIIGSSTCLLETTPLSRIHARPMNVCLSFLFLGCSLFTSTSIVPGLVSESAVRGRRVGDAIGPGVQLEVGDRVDVCRVLRHIAPRLGRRDVWASGRPRCTEEREKWRRLRISTFVNLTHSARLFSFPTYLACCLASVTVFMHLGCSTFIGYARTYENPVAWLVI